MWHCCSRRLFVVVILFAAVIPLVPIDAKAWLVGAGVEPEVPTTEDSVAVWVDGRRPDSCWSPEIGMVCGTVVGDSIQVEITLRDAYQPGDLCIPEAMPYRAECYLGRLAENDYRLVVIERSVSDWRAGSDTLEVPFTVTAVVPVERCHWGRLRCLFR